MVVLEFISKNYKALPFILLNGCISDNEMEQIYPALFFSANGVKQKLFKTLHYLNPTIIYDFKTGFLRIPWLH